MTDGDLLERFVSGHDEAAFELLVRRHGPMVLGLCRRALRDDHEAEDAFQATFLVLVRNAPSIRKRDSLGSWLYGVARRVTLKAKVRTRPSASLHRGEAMAATGHDEDHDREEMRPVLHEEVGRLPAKYRAPIVLCYFEGHSHEEAARQLDWPIGTVKGRLSRARDLLQSRLVRRGVALSLGVVGFLEREAPAAVPDRLVHEAVQAAIMDADGVVTVASDADSSTSSGPGLVPRGRRRLFALALLAALAALIGRDRILGAVSYAARVPARAALLLPGFGAPADDPPHCRPAR